MAESSSGASGGVGFTGLLTIAFVVLKLTGYIAWSWWWVASPVWISTVLVVALVVLCFPVFLWIEHRKRKKRRAILDQLVHGRVRR